MTVTTVTEPVTVTDPATPPLWHARRVTAGLAADATEAAAALHAFGLMPDQLAGESAGLLAIVDFDAAREVISQNHQEEVSMTTVTEPELDLSPGTVRAWAKENRYVVASMGIVPTGVVNAYRLAHGQVLDGGEKIARPTPAPLAPSTTSAALDDLPVTVDERPVTVEELREQLDRLGAGYTDAVTKLNAAHAEVARLQGQSEQDLAKWNMQVTAQRDEIERLAHALAEAREASNREVVLELPTTVVGAPLPEPLADLVDAFHKLFAKASELDTDAAHMVAEQLAPAVVRDTADGLHHLVRLLDGDTTP